MYKFTEGTMIFVRYFMNRSDSLSGTHLRPVLFWMSVYIFVMPTPLILVHFVAARWARRSES